MADYRKRLSMALWVQRGLLLVFGLLLVIVKDNNFSKGVFVGFILGLEILMIFYSRLLKFPEQLKAHYIKVYDERYQTVQGLSAVTTLILLFVLEIILVLLYALWEISLPYQMVLSGALYLSLGIFLLARAFWNNVL